MKTLAHQPVRTQRTARWAAPDALVDRCPLASWHDHVESLDAHLGRTPLVDPFADFDELEDEQVHPFDMAVDALDDVLASLAKREILSGALARLTERQRLVLTLRYGLDGGEPQTLQMIGDRFGFTRERARQIEARAIKEIRLSFGIATEPTPAKAECDHDTAVAA